MGLDNHHMRFVSSSDQSWVTTWRVVFIGEG